MFSMTKSRELDKVQAQDVDVNRRHYYEDVKFYPILVTYRPIVVFPIGYMYHIERCLLSTYWMFYTRPRCNCIYNIAQLIMWLYFTGQYLI